MGSCKVVTGEASMYSVFVKVSGPDPKGIKASRQAFDSSQDGTCQLSASGIAWENVIGSTIVLTPAALVSPFIRPAKRQRLADCRSVDLADLSSISCGLEDNECNARLEGFMEAPGVHLEVRRLTTGSWRWGWKLAGNQQNDSEHQAGAWLAVLSVEHKECDKRQQGVGNVARGKLRQGDCISCKGSPFGCLAPDHLTGFLTTGTIANQPDEVSPVFMADMTCMPGMEGAPVMNSQGALLGMLTLPLSSTTFDTEVPLVVSAHCLHRAWESWLAGRRNLHPAESPHVLRQDKCSARLPHKPDSAALQEVTDLSGNPCSASAQQPDLAPAGLLEACIGSEPTSACPSKHPALQTMGVNTGSIVAVCAAGGWASGVVVHASGLILTVAHAVRGGNAGDVRVRAASVDKPTSWYSAKLVYVFDSALDLAILRIEGSSNPALTRRFPAAEIYRGNLQPGQPISVVGHAGFHPLLLLGPLQFRGIISKVIKASIPQGNAQTGPDPTPAMFLTNATVLPGASGGGVFNSRGELLGLVTSNTKHAPSGRSFPKLNYSIAGAVLMPVVARLSQEPWDKIDWTALDVHNQTLASIWELKQRPEVLDGSLQSRGSQRLHKLLERFNFKESELEESKNPKSRL